MKLIFVYNAHTDPLSVMADYMHKVFSPKTYKCELCALTHHNFGKRSGWAQFIKQADFEMDFMYIKGFEKKYGSQFTYPIVLELRDDDLHRVIEKSKIAEFRTIDNLIDSIKNYIAITKH